MASTSRKVARCKSATTSRLNIPDEILRKLEQLPSARSLQYPDWHDDVIKKYYGHKACTDIARLLGRTTASVTARAKDLRIMGHNVQRYGNDRWVARQKREAESV